MFVTLERRVQILAISNNFEPIESASHHGPLDGHLQARPTHDTHASQIMLSHQEFSGLIRTLYPSNPLPDEATEPSSIPSTSAPPSTTSSSTLQPESNDVSSSASSSIGPNYSGSSVNSDITITGNGPLQPQAPIENVSDRLSASTAPRPEHALDLETDQIASRLWILHAQLYAIARKGIDKAVGQLAPSRWAIFQVQSNGGVALDTTSLSSELLAQSDNLHLSVGSSSDYATLKKAITTLLATPGRRQLPRLDRSRPLTVVQESLRALFEDAMASARLSMDFLSMHRWHRCLEIYSKVIGTPDGRILVKDLFADIRVQYKINIHTLEKQAVVRENLARSLLSLDQQQKDAISALEKRHNALRIKMWYIYDVKHSSTYEEALLVVKALRAMSSSKRSKQIGSTFSWTRQPFRGSQSQERADAQALEAMTAPKDRGGRRKLADDQVDMTSRWLTRTGTENLCTGEERIHRYTYQVQKSVDRLAGASLLESPVLWSSHLFKREKAALDARNIKGSYPPLKPFSHGGSRISLVSGQYGLPPISSPVNVGAVSVGQSTTLPSISSSISNSPMSSIQYPYHRTAHFSPSNTGFRDGQPSVMEQSPLKISMGSNEAFIQNVKTALYGLLASDLGYLLWTDGSETDAWINKAASEEHVGEKSMSATVRSSLEVQTGENQQSQTSSSSMRIPSEWHSNQIHPHIDDQVSRSGFDLSEAYQTLLRKMSTTHDPFIKIEMIWQLERLVVRSIEDNPSLPNATEASGLQSEPMTRSKSVPRTQATNIEEVMANCTERRAEALRATPSIESAVSTDTIVNQLLAIFRSPDLRPSNLFLSLQYISAFIPNHTLDHSRHGEAFWNCCLAALALKEELTNSTVRRAAEITNAHISTARLASPPYPSQQEAANLWLIAAKEGSPVAARELGLFYLTHPHLLPQRVIQPLSKAKDVFRSVRGADGGPSDDSKGRGGLNPLTFDVVYHWMVIASNGGDADAKAFLRQSGSV